MTFLTLLYGDFFLGLYCKAKTNMAVKEVTITAYDKPRVGAYNAVEFTPLGDIKVQQGEHGLITLKIGDHIVYVNPGDLGRALVALRVPSALELGANY